MAFNLVAPIGAGDSYESVKGRLVQAVEALAGAGSASGGNAPVTWGDMRAKVNTILSAWGKPTIGANDRGVVARGRINTLINLEALFASTVLAWWNADRADLITQSGGIVSAWADSMSGLVISQNSIGARPAYLPTGFGNAPCVSFDGVDDALEGSAATFPSGSIPGEVWGVLAQDALASESGSTARGAINYGGQSATTARGLRRLVTGGVNRLLAVGGDGAATSLATLNTVDFSGRHVARSTHGPGGTTVRADGSAPASNPAVPATATDRIRLGALSGTSTTNPWLGRIRDALVTRELTPDQATHLQNFLMPRRAL